MEKVMQRYQMALQTLSTLKEVLEAIEQGVPEEYYLNMRDSAIQRFEYSIDTLWKFLKIYLQESLNMQVESASPRSVIRNALDANIVYQNEFEQLMRCITSRNETSHAYNEELAQNLMDELPSFYETMHTILIRIKI